MKALAPDRLPAIGPAAVTMGVFDGVHLGHQHLLAATAGEARRRGAASVALVFEPHPDEVLRPGTRVPRLAPPADTLARIVTAGIDHALPLRFDDALRSLDPDQFLDALAPAIELRALVMTPESGFGRGRSGTPERMRSLGAERGFATIVVEPLLDDGSAVSSSRVRSALAAGDLETARRLLGRAPLLAGTVVRGEGRGRDLGVPTATLEFGYLPALPAAGIYRSRVAAPGRGVGPAHPALVSIGVRSTFHDEGSLMVEAYLLDWDGDLYGAELRCHLVDRLRHEQPFESAEALMAQMRAVEAEARRRFAADPGGLMAGEAGLW